MRLTERQEEARQYWKDGRSLSVIGTSGSGKTTLALHLALEQSGGLPVRVLICTKRLQMHLDAYRRRLREIYKSDCIDRLIIENRLVINNEPADTKDESVLVVDEFQFEQYGFIPTETLRSILASRCRKIFCSYCNNPLALQSEPPPSVFDETFRTIDLGVKYGHWLIR